MLAKVIITVLKNETEKKCKNYWYVVYTDIVIPKNIKIAVRDRHKY